jgi:outer membrane protein assembly factor BamB
MKLRWVVAGVLGLPILVALITLWANRPPVPIVWRTSVQGIGTDELALGQDGTIYQNHWGVLRAFDRAGKLRWVSPKGIWVDSTPVIGQDGTIYLREAVMRFSDGLVGSNAGLLALHADGSVKWRFPIKGIQAWPDGTAFALDDRDTVYFTVSETTFGAKTLLAVSAQGHELWHFDSTANWTAPVEISKDGSVLLMSELASQGGSKSWLDRFDAAGQRLGQQPQNAFDGLSFSTDWEGSVYFPGGAGTTMTALNADGSLRWRFSSPLHAFSAPTIATDGSLFFTATTGPGQIFLVALSKDGKLQWQFPLGPHFSLISPAVASDGTLFVVSADPKVTAVNKDGTLRWTFRPPRQFRWRWRLAWGRTPANWKDIKKLLSENFGDGMNVLATPPTLTQDGLLYVGFGSPYNALYALNVGVGLATNSPWPTPGGDLRLTRRVAQRPPAGIGKEAK